MLLQFGPGKRGDRVQFDQLDRREFITLVGGAAVAWPIAARAQQPAKLRLGSWARARVRPEAQWIAAFLQRLRELGWIEGRTIAIEYRWAEGSEDRFAQIATELVRLKVDIIVTMGAQQSLPPSTRRRSSRSSSRALETRSAPASLLSLARPGGNITGLSQQQTDTARKRLRTLARGCPWPAQVGDHVQRRCLPFLCLI